MILAIGKGHKHGVWQSPAKAARAYVIVNLEEDVFAEAREEVGVSLEHWLKVFPLLLYLLAVLHGLHLKLHVHELIYLLARPEPRQISWIHDFDERMPKRFLSLQFVIQEEGGQDDLFLVWMVVAKDGVRLIHRS